MFSKLQLQRFSLKLRLDLVLQLQRKQSYEIKSETERLGS